MTQTSLPAARAAFIDQNGRPTPQFYRFLETLATAQAGNVSPDEITAINAQLAELQAEIAALPSAEIPKLQVTYPILSQGLLQNGFAKLALNQPGDSGTGALKGITLDAWGRVTGTTDGTITGTAGRVTVANGDATAGVPTIDLAPVANAGGGSLLKIVRDAWGRITGTSTPTTTDLAEGSNLYFTAARVLATVLAGLSTATNAVITAADSVLSALGKLQAQISANVAAIAAKADDSAVLHLATVDSSHVTTGKYFDGGIVAGAPSDFWAYGNVATNGRSFWGSEGYFGTNGSFAMSFRSNGYRNASTTWTSLGRGGNAGASGIDMLPTGSVRFGADSSTPTSFDITWRWEVTPTAFRAYTDNAYSLGDASHRPTVLWAASGTISTSDAREKTEVSPLTDAELAAAADLSRAIGTYQWIASIADKGADKARHHAGLTVQRAIEIMQAHGLDPFRYGFICYDEWPETPEQRDPETGDITQPRHPAGDRYSFRTNELLMFIARGLAARLDALESI